MLSLHDTKAGRAVPFEPAGDKVHMYVCGPTVYGPIHVGNARPLVVFDVLFRLLRHGHPEVVYVRNITDIDDKIIAAAAHANEEPAQLAARFKENFLSNAKALNTLDPTLQPCATEHISTMIEIIEKLLAKEHAYEADGHVLFDVSSHERYGEVANRNRDQMIAGARVEVAPYKRSPEDFVLWKPSRDRQPGWSSPWGFGRPGWHLECSAMIESCLGGQIDIHGGGMDLAFPHHENENAQSCCAFDLPQLARHWVHNGHVTMGGDKMAKSAGNTTRIDELLSEFSGEAVRYALLTAHYRSPLAWRKEIVSESKAALDRLYRSLGDEAVDADIEMPDDFLAALQDDLNTPLALSCLHELAGKINRGATDSLELRGQLRCAGEMLGLFGASERGWFKQAAGIDEKEVEQLIEQRAVARSGGDYAKADELRMLLEQKGVQIEDTVEGTVWRTS